MRRLTRLGLAAASALAVLAPVAAAGASATAQQATTFINWHAYLAGSAHHSDNHAAVAITPATATGLTRAWVWKPANATMAGQPGPRLYASPTVVDGRVYIGAHTGVFYALDEATGHVIWHRFLGFVSGKTCGARGFTSTATVASDPVTHALTVYVAAASGYLYALSAATGATVWRSVVALPSSTVNDYYNWGSPTVAGGHVYMGVSSQCDQPLVMGGLKEYSQATGKLIAFYKTNPGGSTGPSIWSSAAAPSSGASLFVTTGNGAGPNQVSVVRLDPATLAQESAWQVPAAQLVRDSDFGASPTLFSAKLGSSTVPMVGACNKNGIFYALRRGSLAAGPVWQFHVGSPAPEPPTCLAAAVWDGSHLFVSGNQTVIGGTAYQGSIASVNPATGTPGWQRGLPGPVVGSPTLDGGGVLAVPTYTSSGLFLINAATGKILAQLATGPVFGQPVFADNMMLVPTKLNGLWAYRPTTG
jgi:outer membrane protein assembly factor BamB